MARGPWRVGGAVADGARTQALADGPRHAGSGGFLSNSRPVTVSDSIRRFARSRRPKPPGVTLAAGESDALGRAGPSFSG